MFTIFKYIEYVQLFSSILSLDSSASRKKIFAKLLVGIDLIV